MKFILVTIFFSLTSISIIAQEHQLVWSRYDTSSRIDSKKFNLLTTTEKRLKEADPDFEDNRARLTLTDSGNVISPKELQKADFPVLCYCDYRNDTLKVTVGIGFMANLGIVTTITEDQFATAFFQEADGTKIFKMSESDTVYVDRIFSTAYEQKLTISKRAPFKNKQLVIGKIEGSFHKFYQRSSEAAKPIVRNIKASFLFKCKLETDTL